MLDAETEGTIIAAQDGVTHTRAYRTRVLKDTGSPRCRACGRGDETMGHILSACSFHSWGLYKERHDRVLYLLVQAIRGSKGLRTQSVWRGRGGVAVPAVIGTKRKQIKVDQVIPTDRPITECRPDLLVRWEKKRIVAILDVACAWDPIIEVKPPSYVTKSPIMSILTGAHKGKESQVPGPGSRPGEAVAGLQGDSDPGSPWRPGGDRGPGGPTREQWRGGERGSTPLHGGGPAGGPVWGSEDY